MLLIACVLLIVAFSEVSSAQYRVRRGDTLWGISRRFGTNTRTLQRLNRIRNPNLIRPGERIIYPRASRRVVPRRRRTTRGRRYYTRRRTTRGRRYYTRRPRRTRVRRSTTRRSGPTRSRPTRSGPRKTTRNGGNRGTTVPKRGAPPPPPPPSSGNESIDGIPSSFVNLLKSREGVRYDVYRDSRGFPTSGIGHLMRPADLARYPVGSRVPASQVMQWFANDAGPSYRAGVAQAQALGLSNDQAAVNVFGSMSYQLGNAWPQEFPGLWNLLRQKRYGSAIRDAESTAWERQTPTRVNDLVQVLRERIDQNPATGN